MAKAAEVQRLHSFGHERPIEAARCPAGAPSKLASAASTARPPPVNRLVAGSNPARGANRIKSLVKSCLSLASLSSGPGPHLGPQFANFGLAGHRAKCG